jgi:hypothetical protein
VTGVGFHGGKGTRSGSWTKATPKVRERTWKVELTQPPKISPASASPFPATQQENEMEIMVKFIKGPKAQSSYELSQ